MIYLYMARSLENLRMIHFNRKELVKYYAQDDKYITQRAIYMI